MYKLKLAGLAILWIMDIICAIACYASGAFLISIVCSFCAGLITNWLMDEIIK
jgi:hypothetical protein